MTWEDRLAPAAYRSPLGTRTVFDGYEDVQRTVEKKTIAFEFPGVDGTEVQDLGHKGRRYPLRFTFSGDEHDLRADKFELSLLEIGEGVLEHPRYGQVGVVPFGEIRQRDDLKTAANQTVFEVTFLASLGLVLTVAPDGAATALALISEHQAAAAEELADAVTLGTTLEEVTFRGRWLAAVGAAGDLIDGATEVLDEITDSINQGIDDLIANPLTLAFQTLALIKAPGRAFALIESRLRGYRDLVDSILGGGRDGGGPQVLAPKRGNAATNELATRQVFAQGAVAAAVVATMTTAQEGNYSSRREAVDAAVVLLELMDDVTDWADLNFKALDVVDPGVAYQLLQQAVAVAAGELVVGAGDPRRERLFTVDRPRTMLDVVAEHYDTVDANLDDFINLNSLTGPEMLEIPAGREVSIYE